MKKPDTNPFSSPGQGFVEYSLLSALVTIGIILTLQLFGISVRDLYCDANTALGGESACIQQESCVDDFTNDDGPWKTRKGEWEVEDGQLCTSKRAITFNTCSMDHGEEDYTVKVDGANLTEGKGYGIFFRMTKPDKKYNGYTFQYDPGYHGGAFIFRKWVNGRELKPFAVKRARDYDWHDTSHDVEVFVQGDTFTAYIDGEAVLTGTDDTYSEGGIGLRSWDGTEVCFERFAIGPAPEETE